MKARMLVLTFAALSAAISCGSPSSSSDNTVAAEGPRSESKVGTTPALAPQAQAVAGGVAGESMRRGIGSDALQAMDAASPPPAAADPLQTVDAGTTAPAMVIRTGQAFIEVERVDAAVLKIRQLAAQMGGYITNSSMSGGHDQIRQATVELKIPAPKYDEAVGSLSTIGKVETVNTTAEDVGEEFVDVTARVNNSRRLEERLISLLATRTGKLDEVLRVERELARVREEIERYEGRLRYLSARVAMSTLSITVHEPAPILGSSPGSNPIVAALRRAWRNFVALVAGLIAALGILIPLALIAAAGWIGYQRWRKSRS